jgi:hypothetical protein
LVCRDIFLGAIAGQGERTILVRIGRIPELPENNENMWNSN